MLHEHRHLPWAVGVGVETPAIGTIAVHEQPGERAVSLGFFREFSHHFSAVRATGRDKQQERPPPTHLAVRDDFSSVQVLGLERWRIRPGRVIADGTAGGGHLEQLAVPVDQNANGESFQDDGDPEADVGNV